MTNVAASSVIGGQAGRLTASGLVGQPYIFDPTAVLIDAVLGVGFTAGAGRFFGTGASNAFRSTVRPLVQPRPNAAVNRSQLPIGSRRPSPVTKNDPYLSAVVDAIEEAYPNLVQDVNYEIYRGNNQWVEIDIETMNAIIEVKSGGGTGFTSQVQARLGGVLNPDGKPVIGYGPDLKHSVIQSINRAGGIGTRDLRTLIEILRPD